MIQPLYDPWQGDAVARRVVATLRAVQGALVGRPGPEWLRLVDHALERRGFWVEATHPVGVPGLVVEGRLYLEVATAGALEAAAGFLDRLKRSGCAAGFLFPASGARLVSAAHYRRNPDWAPAGLWQRLTGDRRPAPPQTLALGAG